MGRLARGGKEPWDHEGRTYAIYYSPDGKVSCTAGPCIQEAVHLAGGLVMDSVIECPKHDGQLDYRTSRGLHAPVCVNLATYLARSAGGQVLVQVS